MLTTLCPILSLFLRTETQLKEVGVSLALERLNVWLRKKTVKEIFACGKDRKRQIKKRTTMHMLRDIDAVIHPGQLLAIMGGSGTRTPRRTVAGS